MKGTELRIGNYIKLMLNYEDYETIQVTSDELVDVDKKRADYEPFPLTEDWLYKFGFKNIDKGGNDYITYTDPNHDYYLQLRPSEFQIEQYFFQRSPQIIITFGALNYWRRTQLAQLPPRSRNRHDSGEINHDTYGGAATAVRVQSSTSMQVPKTDGVYVARGSSLWADAVREPSHT